MNLRHYFRLPPTLPDALRHNFIHLFWDIGWWGLYVGSTAAFLSIYATRSGATSQQIGLLAALPALLSLGISLPAGRLLKRFAARPATAAAAFAQRILFLPFALLPWLLPPAQQVDAILVLAVLIAIPTTFIGISYGQFFLESIPADWRGTVVGARNAILAIVTLVVTLLCGQILTILPFPSGYQVVFFIGFVGAIMTSYHIWRVHPFTEAEPPLAAVQAEPAIRPSRFTHQARAYIKVIALLFLFNLVSNSIAPLVPDLLVNKLALSDATISIGTGLTNMLLFSVSLFIARFTRRAGNRRATALGAALFAVHAIVLALATNTTVYLAAACIAGIASGVWNTAQYNYSLEYVPLNERSSWLAWNLLLGNAAVLLGALAGPVVAHQAGVVPTIIFFGVMRLVIGVAIFWWG